MVRALATELPGRHPFKLLPLPDPFPSSPYLIHSSPPLLQVRVPQLQVDGGWERRLPGPPEGLHPPGLPGLRRHLDATGGQLRQAQTHQQRAGRPGTRKQ